MKDSTKKGLRTVGCGAAALIFGGGGLLIFSVFATLTGFPMYGLRALVTVAAVSLAAAVAVCSGYLGRKEKRMLAVLVAVICVLAAAYAGYGSYQDQIPTLDDRTLILSDYQPFKTDGKAVRLDEEADYRMEEGSLLRLDGATALYPVYAGFVQATYPQGEYPLYDDSWDGYATVTCSNTVNAYQRLLSGQTDLIFVAGPSEAQVAEAELQGYQYHLTPIGREAFVFFVNSKNPVTQLTVEQIQKIYTGEIDNWKQVGGKNWSIRPFQRRENSGSQTALQRLMGDLPLMEPEEEERISAMEGIIRQVASYKNYKNAIGFSFRYYATEMVTSDQIRLLALNGVEPTQETIRDGTYPIANEFYAVTAAPIGEPAPQETDPVVKAFLEWILSPQGQEIVEETGYVPL